MPLNKRSSGHRAGTARDAVVTLVAVVLAFGALDDITTDSSSTSFLPERTALAICGLWFAWLSWRFVQRGWRGLGLSSFAVLIIAAAAQWRLLRPMPSGADYVAPVLGLIWFVAMAVVLFVLARRSRQADHEPVIH